MPPLKKISAERSRLSGTAHKKVRDKLHMQMNRTNSIFKILGISVLSFGLGILASFFLPESILVVIEALIIIAIGFLYFSKRW